MQNGLLAGGQVLAVLVPPPTSLGEQHHQVDEGEPEAPDDDRFTGGQGGQVAVRGEVGRQVDEPVPVREFGQLDVLRGGFGIEVADGEYDEVGGQRFVAALQPDVLTAVTLPGDAQGAPTVLMHGDARRKRGHRLLVHPSQIGALQPSARKVLASQRLYLGEEFRFDPEGDAAVADVGRPGVQCGPRTYRPLLLDRVVGEHGDVLGHGVHPEQRGLVVPPDPAAAGRVRVDEMDVQPCGPRTARGRWRRCAR